MSKRNYDVIVIGAGLGGLLSAAQFLRRGQRVAVILWTDDTRAAYQDLVARGAVPLKAPSEWLGRLLIAWTADPDGNPIQIVGSL